MLRCSDGANTPSCGDALVVWHTGGADDIRGHAALAALSGNLTKLDNLLNAGADPNGVDRLGQTPLSSAIVGGQPLTLQRLLQANADPNALMTGRNPQSQTPLQYAAEHGDLRIASILIANGARINDLGGTGRSPLLTLSAISTLCTC